jgi:hypothetical protein
MVWKTMDVKEQRVRFVVTASRREKVVGRFMSRVRDLPTYRVCVVEALRRERDCRDRGT